MRLAYILVNVKNIFKFLKDKNVSKFNKFLLIFAILYVISPIDLIPFPVIGFSILDDIAVFIVILYYLRDYLAVYNIKPDNGNIYENTDYKIDNDE